MHRRIQSLLWLPVVCGLAYVGLDFFIHGQSWYTDFLAFIKIGMKTLALMGSLLALFSFGPQDRMRVVWLLFSLCMLLLLLFEPLNLWLFAHLSATAVEWTFAVFQFLVDLFLLSTFWVLMSIGRDSGLPASGPPWLKGILGALAFAIGLAVFWHLIMDNFWLLLDGKLSAVLLVLAGVFSVATMIMTVPVFFVARALRGGLLFWPWAFLLSVVAAWLALSLFVYIGELFIDDARILQTCVYFFRCLASMLTFSCGLAQRFITGSMRSRQ